MKRAIYGFITVLLISTAFAQSQGAGTEVGPGLLLTSDALVWVLDDGDVKRLLPIAHRDATVAGSTAANFLRSTVLAKQKKTVVVAETKSTSRVHATKPVVFVQLTEAEEKESNRSGPLGKMGYAIIRLEPQQENRVIGKFEFGRISGKPTFTQVVIETKQSRFRDSPWLQVVPVQPLLPGEYALVQVSPRTDVYSSWIFDFGVD